MASDGDYSESEDDDVTIVHNQPLTGRRDIRKIKRFDELVIETKIAKYDEINRKMRIAEFDKELEKLFPDEEAKRKLILDFDEITKQPRVVVHPQLVKYLKEHQKEGISFMWKVCFERVSRLTERGTGCILAHCMGLGKTLQIVALVYTLLTNPKIDLNKILILAPKNTVLNWVHEFEKWIRPPLTSIRIFNPAKADKFSKEDLYNWHRVGGVCVLSYTKFRLLIDAASKDSDELKWLLDPGPDFLVCDEGHVIKNQQSKLAKAFNGLKTYRRVILSGTPIQNNLLEYFSMVSFVRPFLLGTKEEFRNMFENPIQNGQYHDSDEIDVNLMKARSHVLHQTLTSCVQRFDLSTLSVFLHEKMEFVLCVRLTPKQIEAYTYFLERIMKVDKIENFQMGLFGHFQALQRIWSHPFSLKLYDEQPPPPPRKIWRPDDSDDEMFVVRPSRWERGWWKAIFEPSDIEAREVSAKLVVLAEIIQYCFEKEEKLLIFSQSLFSLRLIEYFLNKDRDDGMSGWVNGIDYFVLTGQSTSQERDEMCRVFNDPNNQQSKVFLISTKAGGMGITLNAANRAVIFDACWNPSHDVQSIFRIYRLGQQKQCFIYRLIASGTMEEKIYERQVAKQSTSHRVVDEKQIERHYTASELSELFELVPDKDYNNLDILHKDQLLKRIVAKYPDLVPGYHEHDTLLQHKLDEELREAEKRGAWSDFGEDSADVVEGAMAMGKMINRHSFHIDNFKIVLRKHYPHLTDTVLSTLVSELMPRVENIFTLPNLDCLMAQEAIVDCVKEQASNSSSLIPRRDRDNRPRPVRQWGHMGGRKFGTDEAEEESD